MATTGSRSLHRLAPTAAGALAVALVVSACGGSASPSASASAAAASPSLAPSPSASPSPSPSPSPSLSVAPSTPAVDAAAGLKIGAPYALVSLPAAAQQILEQQMATSLGAAGQTVTFGFRQITGGKGTGSILLVMGFPTGTLTDIGYGAVIGGIAAAMKAELTKTTVSGVEVSSGPIASGSTSTGGIAFYHEGDRLIAAIIAGADEAEALAVAKALIAAN
jgi:hypothetical protein